MNRSDLQILQAAPLQTVPVSGDAPSPSALDLALAQIFAAEFREPNAKIDEERRIIFVPPGRRKAWLQDLLLNLDSKVETAPFFLMLQVRKDDRDDTYAGLIHALEAAGFAKAIDCQRQSKSLLSEILESVPKAGAAMPQQDAADERAPLKRQSRTLHHVIDECLPGGVEGLIEIALRPTGPPRDEIAFGSGLPGAMSLALGAFFAGEVSQKDLLPLTGDDKSADTRDAESSTKNLSEILRDLQPAFAAADAIRNSLIPDRRYLAPLTSYLKGRRIVLIEDRLSEEGWDRLLPAIFATLPSGESPFRLQYGREIVNGDVKWSVFPDMGQLLKEGKSDLRRCDILLLDLASTDTPQHPNGLVSPMIRENLSRLAIQLNKIREEKDPEVDLARRAAVPKGERNTAPPKLRSRSRDEDGCVPVVIGFSAANCGVTTRTLLRDLNVTEFVFKIPQGPVHQRMHFYTLRQAIIGGLERRAAWISYSNPSHFRKWLLQFPPNERPEVLRLMERFRHYSSTSLIRLCRNSLDSQDGIIDPDRTTRWFSYLGRINKSGPTVLAFLAKSLDQSRRFDPTIFRDRITQTPQFATYDDVIGKLRDADYRLTELELVPSITFVDDVIGSGGQLGSYFPKFLSRVEENWTRIKNCRFRIWFALGLNTHELRELLKEESGTLVPGKWYSISYPDPKSAMGVEGKKVRQEEKAEQLVHLEVRIEEVIQSAVEVNEEGPSELETIIRSKSLIVEGRAKEIPCQFEPFGWKSGCGLFSTFLNVPGNTLPIIWAPGYINDWTPLKERYFNPFDEGRVESIPECLSGPNAQCPLDPQLESGNEAAPMKGSYNDLGCRQKFKKIRGGR